jgi:hypothetical protein
MKTAAKIVNFAIELVLGLKICAIGPRAVAAQPSLWRAAAGAALQRPCRLDFVRNRFKRKNALRRSR